MNYLKTYLAGAVHYDSSYIKSGPVQLVREPQNKHDKNAIKILQSGIHIGYVPKSMTWFLRSNWADNKNCIADLEVVGVNYDLYIWCINFVLPKLLVNQT